jgi:hypothetical protein
MMAATIDDENRLIEVEAVSGAAPQIKRTVR